MPHPITSLLKTYDINRHDIDDRSWPGFKRLCEAAGSIFKHNYILYRQHQIGLAMLGELKQLLEEWKAGTDLDEDTVFLQPDRMTQQLEDKLSAYSDATAASLIEAADKGRCTCPPGYACPHCLRDGSWKQNLFAHQPEDSDGLEGVEIASLVKEDANADQDGSR